MFIFSSIGNNEYLLNREFDIVSSVFQTILAELVADLSYGYSKIPDLVHILNFLFFLP